MSKLLEQLVRDSRKELGKREVEQVDWNVVDRKLFARIETERRAESANLMTGRGVAWALGASALAAAAALALVVGKTNERRSLDPLVVTIEPAAGTVVAVAIGGELIVDGKPAATGAVLHRGDVIEVRGAPVTVDRAGKVTWSIEPGSIATVTHVQGPLVLDLARGAVEAQVVPVAAGEAFAVDVDGSRVAVHGTHLRVAKVAEHVSVDLSEGVVVVGPAPRLGSTIGALVTAPAYAEFAPVDASGTLTVSHDPLAMRAPVALGASAGSPSPGTAVPLTSPAAAKSADVRMMLPPLPPRSLPTSGPVLRPQPVPSSIALPPPPDPNAAFAVAATVRSCMASRSTPENVTVVVSTTLHLDLDADGNVRAARFDPPVAPDVNSCAAAAIYRTRFTHDGSADIPVDFKVPSSAP